MAHAGTTTTTCSAGDPRIDTFHRGIYWDEFADQHEPVEVWHAALRGELPYAMSLELALDGEAVVGGICAERYPRSGCGLLTYLVVAPSHRGRGLGKQLQQAVVERLYAAGAPLVLGELNDPRVTTLEPTHDAWERVQRNQRWGARLADVRYIQPALGPGLARDRQLVLAVLAGRAPVPSTIDGRVLRAFVAELYEVTEGGPPDPAISIPDEVRLLAL